jgi:hypothetical protein
MQPRTERGRSVDAAAGRLAGLLFALVLSVIVMPVGQAQAAEVATETCSATHLSGGADFLVHQHPTEAALVAPDRVDRHRGGALPTVAVGRAEPVLPPVPMQAALPRPPTMNTALDAEPQSRRGPPVSGR